MLPYNLLSKPGHFQEWKGRLLIITLRQCQKNQDEWSFYVKVPSCHFMTVWVCSLSSWDIPGHVPSNSGSNPSWRYRCNDQFGKLNLASRWASNNISQASRPPIWRDQGKGVLSSNRWTESRNEKSRWMIAGNKNKQVIIIWAQEGVSKAGLCC